MQCPKCDALLVQGKGCVNPYCEDELPNRAKVLTGWICPICKGGISPNQTRCPCVSLNRSVADG